MKRIVVGISGASGIQYGVRLLEVLRELEIESHLVMTKAAELTLAYEMDMTPKDVQHLASYTHSPRDMAASISSGSFQTLGMIVAPCSARSIADIASGTGATLLGRAADVTLKERRPLALLLRESPLSLIHIRNMETVTLAGATVCLPVPAFYNRPQSLDEVIDEGVGRLLDQFGINTSLVTRWTE